jgi:hypothetical protein
MNITTPPNMIPDRKKLPFGGAHAVVSPGLSDTIKNMIKMAVDNDCLDNTRLQEQFLTNYREWILSTKLNTVQGLENFPVAAYSNGTTEGFDKFYLKNIHRRFRCFRAEYMYHQASWRNYFPNWKFIDDEPLDSNDAVVISLPFSDLGCRHPQTINILKICDSLDIPVLLDCAYFGICQNVVFDFNYNCITDITFSLSKFLPVPHLRIGMRLTRSDDDDSLLVLNKTSYTNRIGLAVGLQIFKDFTSDYICNTYRDSQINLCEQLSVVPSNCIIFGLGNIHDYHEYNRGSTTSRLCLAKYLDKNLLPIIIK